MSIRGFDITSKCDMSPVATKRFKTKGFKLYTDDITQVKILILNTQETLRIIFKYVGFFAEKN